VSHSRVYIDWHYQLVLNSYLGSISSGHSELKREKAWSRIHLVPMIMAEADRDAYRREQGQLAREKEIMKDIPDWKAGKGVYNTKRYTPANFVVI
jgi:NADH dehydrogenase (ubiquinone) 1 alpha subcomplex subunit 13